MSDIQISRETYILVSESGSTLFPHPSLFPATTLYPQTSGRINNIVSGSMYLDEMLYDGDLRFGQLCATCFEVTVYDTDDISGKFVSVYQDINGIYTQVFTGTVDSAKLDRLGTDRRLICYDPAFTLSQVNVASWWETFWQTNSSATLKQIRESLLSYVGVTYDITTTLINDNITFTKSVVVSSLSFSDMIRMVCELSCCFPHFDRNGELQFVILDTNETPNSLESLYEGESSDFEESTTDTYSGIQFYGNSSDLQYSTTIPSPAVVNWYSVTENILTYNLDESQLNTIGTNMLNYMKYLTYLPSDVKMIVSDWDYTLGSSVSTTKGKFYVTHNTMEGIQFVEQSLQQSTTQSNIEAPAVSQVSDILNDNDKAEMRENIDQIDQEWRSSISGMIDVWDEGDYVIDYRSFGEPVADEYELTDVGSKYLDEETGKIYTLESYSSGGETLLRWVYTAQLGTTKAALQTQITQNATDITLEASRAVSSENSLQASINVNATAITQRVVKGDVVSEINQSADTISLTAGRLLITTGNFTLDASGNATATNFTAHDSIKVYARNGGGASAWLSMWPTSGRYLDILSADPTSSGSLSFRDMRAGTIYSNGSIVATADQIPTKTSQLTNDSGYLTSHQSLSGYVNDVEQDSWSNTWTTWSNHTIVKSATKSGKTITVTNVTVNVSSDKRLKKGIRELDDFTKVYMRLKPVRYKYHDDLGFEDRGIHFGFIAQDFKRICDEEGIDLSNNEYAIWHTRQADALGHEDKYVKDDGLQEFILDEFHALHIQMIQKQQRQIEVQGKEIESLKSEVAELKALLKEVLNVGEQK